MPVVTTGIEQMRLKSLGTDTMGKKHVVAREMLQED